MDSLQTQDVKAFTLRLNPEDHNHEIISLTSDRYIKVQK